MKKNMLFFAAVFSAFLILTNCSSSGSKESSIAGMYINNSSSKIEIKEDGSYIEWECEINISNVNIQTADPDAKLPTDCKIKSQGKWTLINNVLKVGFYPYEFGVKSDRLFYNDIQYGTGTIEYIKQ